MRYGSLVEAALLDQTERVLAARPLEVGGRRGAHIPDETDPTPLAGPHGAEKVLCNGSCGRVNFRSQVARTWVCHLCRRARRLEREAAARAAAKVRRERDEAQRQALANDGRARCPTCGRKLRLPRGPMRDAWYCTNSACAKKKSR